MKLSIKDLLAKATENLHLIGRYAVLLFFLLLAGVYGFLIFRINSLSNATPTDSSPVSTVQVPHIDPTVVKQLQQLQDNSVSVKSLFDQARSNPFQE